MSSFSFSISRRWLSTINRCSCIRSTSCCTSVSWVRYCKIWESWGAGSPAPGTRRGLFGEGLNVGSGWTETMFFGRAAVLMEDDIIRWLLDEVIRSGTVGMISGVEEVMFGGIKTGACGEGIVVGGRMRGLVGTIVPGRTGLDCGDFFASGVVLLPFPLFSSPITCNNNYC